MKVFYDVVNGLALFYVLFNSILMVGGRRFWNWLNHWQREGKTTVPVFFLAGLYVFGGIGTGFVLEFARVSGQWYAVAAGVAKIFFEVMFIVCAMLMTKFRKEKRERIRDSFHIHLFMLFSGVLGFGCAVSTILIVLTMLRLI